jgi:hypothetical protein
MSNNRIGTEDPTRFAFQAQDFGQKASVLDFPFENGVSPHV